MLLLRIVTGCLLLAGSGWLIMDHPTGGDPPSGMVIHQLDEDDWDPDGPALGGLSGICYDSSRQVYYCISDKAPARFYTLQVDSFGAAPEVIDETRISFTRGLEPGSVDPEAIRLHPDGKHLYWSNEANSTVYRMDLEGRVDRCYPLPRAFQPDLNGTGIRTNAGLESLAISPDGSALMVATENMLKQDEDCASDWMPPYQPLRLVVLSISTGQIIHEYLYFAENGHGLVDLVWDEVDHLLCLERSWSPLTGNDILVFRADLRAATDVRSVGSLCELDPDTVRPVTTRLVYNLQAGRKSGFNPYIDNVEGLCPGPPFPNGKQTLTLVSDNNFSRRQVTQFIQILPIP
ncbi:MAG: esterase-like activity of phytase family protein [Lewinellaceae bacterium]|nr:esterase-like activity of phytase family protein [Saprospiraceae bacterium]MCB9311890.1 esterase-like activity of phytase family protein [Lewinellaceae bacterium]HRW74474.1 esterase-like activity of phytase family protein [Saprospiraceae bacterium]